MTSKSHIVVVDDDHEMRALLEDFLTQQSFKVTGFNLASDALKYFAESPEAASVDLIISDLRMPQIDGLTFIEKLKSQKVEIPLILITAFGSVETAIEAIKKGAFDYITKPFKLAELLVHVERGIEFRRLRQDNEVLREEVQREWTMGDLIGRSPGMQRVFDMVNRLSHTNANVLITGESGTGKEMVARALHTSGARSKKPFIAINCSAIPENLLESELFGHAKGSFTGAIQAKRGLFEEANGGTLFLDEIGDMNVLLQAKLLRVIQEKKVRPVGSNESKDIDVRVIAATHKNLRQAIQQGQFREDLYYRLAVIPVVIPPLRERPEDIPLLANYFMKKYCAANGIQLKKITPEAMHKLSHMRWEGNVRELENLIERIVILTQTDLIKGHDIPTTDPGDVDSFFNQAIRDLPTIEKLEKKYIAYVLEKTNGKKERASQILGINRRTLYRKEREYGFVPLDEAFESQEQSETVLSAPH